jgi:hypothetical protein
VAVAAMGGQSFFPQWRLPCQTYRKLIESAQNFTALQNDLFEEKVNLYTGKAQFLATDIDLPGNNSLPVRLTAVSNATPDEVIYAGCYEKDI